jgi:hypothetical protein
VSIAIGYIVTLAGEASPLYEDWPGPCELGPVAPGIAETPAHTPLALVVGLE